MRARVAIHLEQWFLNYARSFISGAAAPAVLRFKLHHCRRVAEDMTGIARDLDLSESEINTARILGWLHDVGRFPQYARYKTLRDEQSVNHGRMGLRVLDGARVLAICEAPDRKIIRMGTLYHNCHVLALGMPTEVQRFLLMIRDADKLDIMQTICQIWENDQVKCHPDLIMGINVEGPLSALVLADIRARHSVAYAHIKSLADFYMTMISWVYDLNYRPTCQRFIRRHFLEKIARFLPKSKVVQTELAAASRHVRARCSGSRC